jgi:putative membrane protein insertion efficiency factor
MMSKLLSHILTAPILAYRYLISPMIAPRCRYLPTCSDYALEAIRVHGALKGGGLALCRLCRCHPLGGHGYDPVPPAHCGHAMHKRGS